MNIVVCTVARSGSNWFRDELVLRGYPECSEWYHPGQPVYNSQRKGRIGQAHLEGKDFGVKLFPEHVKKHGGLQKIFKQIDNPPNVFIRLKRNDIDAQSISWAGANSKGSWFESTRQYAKNPQKVQQFRQRIIDSNKFWDQQLATRDHLVVVYEDMKKDVDYELSRIVDYIESKR